MACWWWSWVDRQAAGRLAQRDRAVAVPALIPAQSSWSATHRLSLLGKPPTSEMECQGGGPRTQEPVAPHLQIPLSESEDDRLRLLVTPWVGMCSVALKPGEEAP